MKTGAISSRLAVARALPDGGIYRQAARQDLAGTFSISDYSDSERDILMMEPSQGAGIADIAVESLKYVGAGGATAIILMVIFAKLVGRGLDILQQLTGLMNEIKGMLEERKRE